MTPISHSTLTVNNDQSTIPHSAPTAFTPDSCQILCLGSALFMCFIVRPGKTSQPLPPPLFKNRGTYASKQVVYPASRPTDRRSVEMGVNMFVNNIRPEPELSFSRTIMNFIVNFIRQNYKNYITKSTTTNYKTTKL